MLQLYISCLLPRWEDLGMIQSYVNIVAVVIAFLETSRVTFHRIVVAYELQYLNSRLEKMTAESLLLFTE
jgi:hypothetical protein